MQPLDNVLDAALKEKSPTIVQIAPYISRGASPELAEKMYYFCLHMIEVGMPILVYQVYRNSAAQAQLYAQGRTTSGRIVTNARAGQSAHNREVAGTPSSDAFDACPIIDGKPSWATSGGALVIWCEMGRAAGVLGLEWGRRYKTLGGDWAHFEYRRTTINA